MGKSPAQSYESASMHLLCKLTSLILYTHERQTKMALNIMFYHYLFYYNVFEENILIYEGREEDMDRYHI